MVRQDPLVQIDSVEAKTLFIHDEAASGYPWGFVLAAVGMEVVTVPMGPQVMTFWADLLPDLIILEDFNPTSDVLSLCTYLRQETPVPILLLTTRTEEEFQVCAYQAGVDECIILPLAPNLFVAKAHVWLRRTRMLPAATVNDIRVREFRLEPSVRRLTNYAGQMLKLTNLELRLLLVLMAAPGKPVDQVELIDRVWGPYGGGNGVMLKNVVYRLRRKIEPDPREPRYLVTVNHIAYKFMD